MVDQGLAKPGAQPQPTTSGQANKQKNKSYANVQLQFKIFFIYVQFRRTLYTTVYINK